MAVRSSDGTRTQGFWHLGTAAWAIWTLPWEREEEERRPLEIWLMESGPDALARIPLVISHILVLPPVSARRHPQAGTTSWPF